jgi:hypothetical protein
MTRFAEFRYSALAGDGVIGATACACAWARLPASTIPGITKESKQS